MHTGVHIDPTLSLSIPSTTQLRLAPSDDHHLSSQSVVYYEYHNCYSSQVVPKPETNQVVRTTPKRPSKNTASLATIVMVVKMDMPDTDQKYNTSCSDPIQ